MTSQETPIIELRNVNKHFGALHVLKDISLQVKKGEVVVIIGPSGSGIPDRDGVPVFQPVCPYDSDGQHDAGAGRCPEDKAKRSP